MEERIVERLRKVLALTQSPVEGEAQAAAAMLAKLLTDHNLSMADLEKRGAGRPGIREEGHDLGKAAFTWKLDLAEAIAEHYYCASLVDRKTKTVAFVGRPDNVESLQMLYAWLIDQIRRIASEERVKHIEQTSEHIDPLRWQVNFGIGAVSRLAVRLQEKREEEEQRQRETAVGEQVTALVLSHSREVSDFLEEKYGYRTDGRKTKAEDKREQEWREYLRKNAEEMAAREELRETNPEEYYRLYPWETAEAKARQAKEDEKYFKKEAARERRNAARRTGPTYRPVSEEEHTRRRQGRDASDAGYAAADRVNLQPFIEGQTTDKDRRRIG